jgi:hypothetical protein
MKTYNEIAHEYRPYDQMNEFQIGAQDYMDSQHANPYGSSSAGAQAWDRGHEAAMRFVTQQYRKAS